MTVTIKVALTRVGTCGHILQAAVAVSAHSFTAELDEVWVLLRTMGGMAGVTRCPPYAFERVTADMLPMQREAFVAEDAAAIVAGIAELESKGALLRVCRGVIITAQHVRIV